MPCRADESPLLTTVFNIFIDFFINKSVFFLLLGHETPTTAVVVVGGNNEGRSFSCREFINQDINQGFRVEHLQLPAPSIHNARPAASNQSARRSCSSLYV